MRNYVSGSVASLRVAFRSSASRPRSHIIRIIVRPALNACDARGLAPARSIGRALRSLGLRRMVRVLVPTRLSPAAASRRRAHAPA